MKEKVSKVVIGVMLITTMLGSSIAPVGASTTSNPQTAQTAQEDVLASSENAQFGINSEGYYERGIDEKTSKLNSFGNGAMADLDTGRCDPYQWIANEVVQEAVSSKSNPCYSGVEEEEIANLSNQQAYNQALQVKADTQVLQRMADNYAADIKGHMYQEALNKSLTFTKNGDAKAVVQNKVRKYVNRYITVKEINYLEASSNRISAMDSIVNQSDSGYSPFYPAYSGVNVYYNAGDGSIGDMGDSYLKKTTLDGIETRNYTLRNSSRTWEYEVPRFSTTIHQDVEWDSDTDVYGEDHSGNRTYNWVYDPYQNQTEVWFSIGERTKSVDYKPVEKGVATYRWDFSEINVVDPVDDHHKWFFNPVDWAGGLENINEQGDTVYRNMEQLVNRSYGSIKNGNVNMQEYFGSAQVMDKYAQNLDGSGNFSEYMSAMAGMGYAIPNPEKVGYMNISYVPRGSQGSNYMKNTNGMLLSPTLPNNSTHWEFGKMYNAENISGGQYIADYENGDRHIIGGKFIIHEAYDDNGGKVDDENVTTEKVNYGTANTSDLRKEIRQQSRLIEEMRWKLQNKTDGNASVQIGFPDINNPLDNMGDNWWKKILGSLGASIVIVGIVVLIILGN